MNNNPNSHGDEGGSITRQPVAHSVTSNNTHRSEHFRRKVI